MSGKHTSVVFTGDIGFDRYMDRKWEDENLLSQDVLDYGVPEVQRYLQIANKRGI